MYLRENLSEGIIKINKITIDYYWKALSFIGESMNFNYPFELTINFYSNFLKNNPSTYPLLIEREEDKSNLKWNEEKIPLLTTVIGDSDFLVNKNITLIISVNDNEKISDIIIGIFYYIYYI